MTAEDNLLNALESAGLIREDWQGIDHQDLPKDIRDAVTKTVNVIRANAMCPISQYASEQWKIMEDAMTEPERR